MCGIFGYIGKRTEAVKIVFSGIKTLEYRGYDSWGVAAVDKKKIFIQKQIGKIGNATLKNPPESSRAIAHTRWATHGGITVANAHPHPDCSKTIAIIHNGIIENYDALKKNLRKHHRFLSETDTEVAVHMIEEYMESLVFPDAVRKTFLSCTGSNALVAIKTNSDEIVAVKNGSPLVIGFGKGENFIASDAAGLLPYTNKVYYLEDNEMAVVTPETVEIRSVLTNRKKRIKETILSWTTSGSGKGTYASFMEKEMQEQPDVITRIAQNAAYTQSFAHYIQKSRGAYLIGCGTAYYAAVAGEYIFSKIAKRHINIAVASEFGYHLDFLNRDSLVIPISQSGETMDIIESVKKARGKGAKIMALVNVPGSTLARMADDTIAISAGPEKAVASTKAFTAMLAHLILLAGGPLTGVSDATRKVLSDTSITPLAKKLKNSEHIFTIGRGLSYPTALEAALKIKEISYIHAEGLAAGELKHGTLALVEKGTPVIAFLPNDETYGANLAGAMEMKARGALIIGISHKPHEIFDRYVHVQDAGIATIIPNVVVAQRLAYALARARGLDPDMPRNLAKSVTVK